MAQKIVEKLEILNQQAKILLARRKKKYSGQCYIKKKTSVTPLTFDFQLESKEAITATSTSMTVSQSREDKPHGITKTKSYVSLKDEPEPRKSDLEKLNLRLHAGPTNIKNQENKSVEPVEENRKSKYDRSFLYLKDSNEHRKKYKRTLGTTISSPIPSTQSNAYKKEKVTTSSTAQTEKKPEESFETVVYLKDYVNKRRKSSLQMSEFCTKENESVRIDPLSDSVGKKSLLSLCFEDELKKPNAKIMSISPAKTVTAHKEQNDTNPIIFHETKYVRMFLLTENRFLFHSMKNRNTEPTKRVNFVLERNREILKPLINYQCIISYKPKRTMPTAWRKHMQVISSAMGHRAIEDKLKKKSTMQTSKNISEKSCSFSEPFSSLTKKCVGFLSKTVVQETSAKTDKFERVSCTVKPTTKFSASPIKSSKPLKTVLQVHKLQTVTPLDDLLTFSPEN